MSCSKKLLYCVYFRNASGGDISFLVHQPGVGNAQSDGCVRVCPRSTRHTHGAALLQWPSYGEARHVCFMATNLLVYAYSCRPGRSARASQSDLMNRIPHSSIPVHPVTPL